MDRGIRRGFSFSGNDRIEIDDVHLHKPDGENCPFFGQLLTGKHMNYCVDTHL
jgi:hypothetical protein